MGRADRAGHASRASHQRRRRDTEPRKGLGNGPGGGSDASRPQRNLSPKLPSKESVERAFFNDAFLLEYRGQSDALRPRLHVVQQFQWVPSCWEENTNTNLKGHSR